MEVLDLLETVQTEDNAVQELIAQIEAGDISLSYSSIKAFMKSPRHFLSYKLKRFETTKAMDEGTLVDMLLTEPENVKSVFGVIPADCNKSSKVGVAKFCEFLGIDVPEWGSRGEVIDAAIEASGKTFVEQHVIDKCNRIADAVRSNPASRFIVEMTEHTQYPVDFEAFGFRWKGKLDCYSPEFFINDYKKTKDAAPYRFHRQMRDLKYPIQAAIYRRGIFEQTGHELPCFITAYDNESAVSVTELKPATLDLEWEYLGRVVDDFQRCITLGEWHKSYDFHANNFLGHYSY